MEGKDKDKHKKKNHINFSKTDGGDSNSVETLLSPGGRIFSFALRFLSP